MAQTQPKKQLTWKQKLDQGLPLNRLEDAQADADFNYRQRAAQAEAEAEFRARKNASGTRPTASANDTGDSSGDEEES